MDSANAEYQPKTVTKPFIRNNAVNRRISKTEGVIYACNQCDYQATQQSNLTIHIQSKHEGIKYACNQCEFQATAQGSLQRHIQSKHEGIKYPCKHCDYQATQKVHLQNHIAAKHSDRILKGDHGHCDYQTKWRQSYNTRFRTTHAIA